MRTRIRRWGSALWGDSDRERADGEQLVGDDIRGETDENGSEDLTSIPSLGAPSVDLLAQIAHQRLPPMSRSQSL
jgi:hypothetical protein